MKRAIAGLLMLACLDGETEAACSGTRAACAGLRALKNKTLCAIPAAGYSGSSTDRWAEQLGDNLAACVSNAYPGSTFGDYKKGTDPVDPTVSNLGTWSVIADGANSQLQFSYAGGPTVSYIVYPISGPVGSTNSVFSLCDAGNNEIATVKLISAAPGVNPNCASNYVGW